MSVQKAYDQWSVTYDEVENKTRDLEKRACETILSTIAFDDVIELGGGTGKNTSWLADRAKHIISVDISEEMQAVAKQKVGAANVDFRIADIKREWNFEQSNADLITCSLILEHVEDLDFVFAQAREPLKVGGHFYICELHPFKQYAGSKARFETDCGTQVLDCFVHNLTDYTDAAAANGFSIARMDEWFDDDDRTQIPRLISFLFRCFEISER
jgi:ubiquinone/menaquinone biosynthesis C-methylase UbiE